MGYVYLYVYYPTLLSDLNIQNLLDPLLCDNSQGVIHISETFNLQRKIYYRTRCKYFTLKHIPFQRYYVVNKYALCLSICLLTLLSVIQYFSPFQFGMSCLKICYFLTMPIQIYKKYFRDIQENTEHLLSKDSKIFLMKQYTFVTVIICTVYLFIRTLQTTPLVSRD